MQHTSSQDFYRKKKTKLPHQIHESPWKAITERDITTNKIGRCEPAKPASGQDPDTCSCEHGNSIRIAWRTAGRVNRPNGTTTRINTRRKTVRDCVWRIQGILWTRWWAIMFRKSRQFHNVNEGADPIPSCWAVDTFWDKLRAHTTSESSFATGCFNLLATDFFFSNFSTPCI